MSVKTDGLLHSGCAIYQPKRQRREYLSKLFRRLGDWVQERQIKIAQRKLLPIQAAVQKMTGSPAEIRVGKKDPFPVSMRTGLTTAAMDYAAMEDTIPYEREHFYLSSVAPELVVKARGGKIVLQAGRDLKDNGSFIAPCTAYRLEDRIVARGRYKVLRYLKEAYLTLNPASGPR